MAKRLDKLVLTLHKDKETPGTIRYKAPTVKGEVPHIEYLYVRRSGLDLIGTPASIEVTVVAK